MSCVMVFNTSCNLKNVYSDVCSVKTQIVLFWCLSCSFEEVLEFLSSSHCPTKTWISLHICAGWSKSLLDVPVVRYIFSISCLYFQHPAIHLGFQCLDRQSTLDTYTLAIATYAYTLYDPSHPVRERMMDELNRRKISCKNN